MACSPAPFSFALSGYRQFHLLLSWPMVTCHVWGWTPSCARGLARGRFSTRHWRVPCTFVLSRVGYPHVHDEIQNPPMARTNPPTAGIPCSALRPSVLKTVAEFRETYPNIKEWNYTVLEAQEGTGDLKMLHTMLDTGTVDNMVIRYRDTDDGCVALAESTVCVRVRFCAIHARSRFSLSTLVCAVLRTPASLSPLLFIYTGVRGS